MAGPTALVTGAARGIGRACALELARGGFDVAVADVIDTAEAVAEITALGRGAVGVHCDITVAAQRSAALHAVRERFGRLDCLVNNAGVAPRVRADLLDTSEESYDFVMGVNAKGPYFLTQAVARWMIEQRAADPTPFRCIINIASVSSYAPSMARGEYCLSKAAVSMATRLWAARLAEHGINVYEMRPGIIATDMTNVVKAKYDKLINEGLTPIKRWGQPADVARAVATCAAGVLPFSTGQVIDIDGGFHLRIL
jgi:NAD(P)-dependent dehydrogenase (short-subunit alcohol dehydrogenase family)